jgi:hypothetical protein
VQPASPGAAINDVFRSLKLDETARSFRACQAFARAAGPRIVARARAERLRGAILHVRCVSSAWSHELNILKSTLVDKLKRTPGGEGVEDLRFSVGPLEELPDWDQKLEPRATAQRSTGAPIPEELERTIDDVKDPELRALIGETVRRSGAA